MNKKFRAWSKTAEKWITPDMLGDPDRMTVRCTDEGFRFLNGDESDFVFCQWTGLNDKNGTPIYESDIVVDTESDAINAIGVVDMDPMKEGFLFGGGDEFCYKGFIELIHRGRIEVIGNIYENKDLLC